MTSLQAKAAPAGRDWYRTVWRWHFYDGLFCIPFVVMLSITGTIYLFKPQIETLIDKPYDHLAVSGHPARAAAQVGAALAAVPGASLHSYELPRTAESAVRIIVGSKGQEYRVYVHPETLAVLKIVGEDDRLMQVIFRLHGELLMGDKGSALVELAASWAIVMIVTGLYLWWPRQSAGLAGILYPRIGIGGRLFWRDIHAVTGIWISSLALFMLLTGLPWAKQWGGDLKALRDLAGTTVQHRDWTTGRSSEIAERRAMDSDPMAGMSMVHAGHGNGVGAFAPPPVDAYAPLDKLVETTAPLGLAPPVLISPPNKRSAQWTARSDAQNRTLRTDLVLDGQSGAILSRKDFGQREPIDRAIGIGIAAHEGQLFGWPNQLLGVLTAAGLICVAASAVVMWWRRKPEGVLGAPLLVMGSRFSVGLCILMVLFGIFLPLLGISMILIVVVERLVLRRIPSLRNWLGLAPMPDMR